MSCFAIIAAGGTGTRMGGDKVKTLQELAGEAVVCHSVRKFSKFCDGIILVTKPEDKEIFEQALEGSKLSVTAFAKAGAQRRDSVHNALQLLPPECDIVLVHDAARPLVSEGLIKQVIQAAKCFGSAVPALPLLDTVKLINDQGQSVQTLERHRLRSVQTPQGFERSLLDLAYHEVKGSVTDDASLVEALGVPVHLVPGERDNMKLTLPGDLERAQEMMRGMQDIRVGLGYDVHRLAEGRSLILFGVNIPYVLGLLGHSDADVAAHALTDALLGACALGDIGMHFPDTQAQFKGADSMELLRESINILEKAGYSPRQVDITIVAQQPKLAGYIPQMRENLADTLKLPLDHISVKATTTEKLGFEGRGEGISAQAVATVSRIR